MLYYSGRNNPPHPEVWVNYFLRMVLLYSNKICELSESSSADEISGSLSYLKGKEVQYNESLRHSEDGLLEKSSQELPDMFLATKRLEGRSEKILYLHYILYYRVLLIVI